MMGWAFLLVMLQFASAWYGYGQSHLTYILYKYVNIYQNFTNEAMALAMITVFCAGFIMLVLSLVLIMRLFLFDAQYIRGNSPKKGS